MQAGLWGEIGVADERAHRALVRVQGLLGPDSVFTAVLGGGRSYADRVRLVPWGEERSPGRLGGEERSPGRLGGGRGRARREQPPWPGRLPAPAPATVLGEHIPIVVHTTDGAPLAVDARLVMTGPPASVTVGREPPASVTGWAGPWPMDERWWAPGEASRLVRLQICLADGRALLVACVDGQWAVEAIYD
jgi:protein ImuB